MTTFAHSSSTTRMCAALAALAAATLVSPAQATIIGIDFSGNVVSIDETTGAGAGLGASGYNTTNSMARDGSGTIFTARGNAVGAAAAGQLITIDPLTGAGTGGALFATTNGARGLAFSAGNVLYALLDTGPSGSIGPDSLYTIDVATGATVLIGATGRSDLQGLAFSPSGTLYGWDIELGLMTLNTGTGVATDVNPLSSGSGDIQTIDFAPDGTLYGARDGLYTIDPLTGGVALIGSGGYADLRGIAVIGGTAVPAPAGIGILALGAGALAWGRRRAS